MAEHTKGPWECFYKHKYDEWHVSVPIAGSNMKLALFDDGVMTDNSEADARLIAAAPDLLEALRRCQAVLMASQYEPGQNEAPVLRDGIVDLALKETRAAIAKATGEA